MISTIDPYAYRRVFFAICDGAYGKTLFFPCLATVRYRARRRTSRLLPITSHSFDEGCVLVSAVDLYAYFRVLSPVCDGAYGKARFCVDWGARGTGVGAQRASYVQLRPAGY